MADKKQRGGGPKTPEGKARSSENSTKHGMFSKAVRILEDESPEEYFATRAGWIETFDPEGYQEERLVEQLILDDWLLKRANRWYQKTEEKLAEGGDSRPEEWTEAQERKLQLMLRYRTTHERSFYRAMNALQQLGKDRTRMQREMTGWIVKSGKQALEIEELRRKQNLAEAAVGHLKPRKDEKLRSVDQWAEISVGPDGQTRTEVFPPNELVLELLQKSKERPHEVYRHLHFTGAVPDEYAWTTDDESIRASGGMGNQRMTYSTWKQQIVKEAGGHLQPCGGNLPRHESLGLCACEVCTANAGMRMAA